MTNLDYIAFETPMLSVDLSLGTPLCRHKMLTSDGIITLLGFGNFRLWKFTSNYKSLCSCFDCVNIFRVGLYIPVVVSIWAVYY